MKVTIFAVLVSVVSLGSSTDLGKLPRIPRNESSLDIIHGKRVSIKKFPYMASLSLNGMYGSGVILNKHWILTTAFNVDWVNLEDIQFRVGSSKMDSGGQLLQAQKIVVHENYTGSWDWDIAVVRVKKEIKFSKKAKPIGIAKTDLKKGTKAVVTGWGETADQRIAKTDLKKGTKAVVAGWGETADQSFSPSEYLMKGQVTILDWKKCYDTYGSQLTSRLMCSFDKKRGPCVFDYGDPLVVRGVVHGLYAGGVSCTPGENPVLYTDVFSLRKWVKQAIKKGDEDL